MASRSTIIRDLLYFLKNDLSSNVTDPISGTRSSKSAFVMTSYPQRPVQYPLITIKIPNIEWSRAGMASTQMDIILTIEIRVWAKNEKQKDEIYNEAMERLTNIQFTTSGSIDTDFHDFNVTSSNEVDEDGEGGIKSRVATIEYKFYS